MKIRTLIAAATLSVSGIAHSETWINVEDADDGTRLMVDIDSFSPSKGDDGTIFIGAAFRFISEGNPRPAFAYVTEVASCSNKGGPLYHRAYESNKWVTKGKYWWSDTGSKMYDTGGAALCAILRVKVKEEVKPERKMY